MVEDLGDLGIDLGQRGVEVVGGKLRHEIEPTSAAGAYEGDDSDEHRQVVLRPCDGGLQTRRPEAIAAGRPTVLGLS